MQALKIYRDKAKGVSDLLNWAALIDAGTLLGKDGSLIAGFFYTSKDIASATPAERNYITNRINQALLRLDNRWTITQDAVRMPSSDYPVDDRSHFPDPISQLIEIENKDKFRAEGQHFETYYVLILTYTPPLNRQSKLSGYLYDTEGKDLESLADKHLEYFNKILDDLSNSLAGTLVMQRMGEYDYTDRFGGTHLRDELINYLHFASTGHFHPINIPPVPMYADEFICGEELWVGDMPKIGNNFVCCVSLEGFPSESYPNILAILEHLPMAYRWSNRMIMLDQHEGVEELKKKRRRWRQKQRGFFSQVFKIGGGLVNEDALLMASETESAINDSNSGLVAFGYYTSVIVLMGADKTQLYENARLLVREVQREGFTCRVETVNTLEAWLGTLPGHIHQNVRRSLIHTLNLADLLPLSTIWSGHEQAPCPFYPVNSPPLLYSATSGSTPFRLNLHVGDTGHTMVFGPTGAGKSTLLAMIIAQFRRYKDSTVFAFDKGNSFWALVNACGGYHYDIAADDTPHFAPLSVLETESDLTWASEWLETCYQLQTSHAPTPRQREKIMSALKLLRDSSGPEHRSISEFITTVQDQEIRSALNFYSMDGTLGQLLDSANDGLQDDAFTVVEIEELMALGEKSAIPVLLYLFRRFEKSLKGQPALLVLDEAWIMLGHEVFREQIRGWLKGLRKKNCAVILATQSLSDAVNSGIFDVLIESCPTKILLPNEEANKGGSEHFAGPRDMYTTMGLNDAEIHIIETAIKKRHYYYVSTEGRRLFDLGLGAIALSFVAISDKATVSHLKTLKAKHGQEWPYLWLRERRVAFDTV